MTITAFRAIAPEILDVWEGYLAESEGWVQRVMAEQDRLERAIYRTAGGFSRTESVVGLENVGELPAGWVKLKKNDFLVPARGKEGESAQAWLVDHQPPVSIGERLAPYGVQRNFMTAGRCYWPGLTCLQDVLYVSWGVDTGWDGGEHFESVKLSEYYAAEEAAVAKEVSA